MISDHSFGILTLATQSDFRKAIGLALSLRKTNPTLSTAIACRRSLFPQVREFFDHCVPERENLRGFEHKLYLNDYSPFERTLFLDADILVFKSLEPTIAKWAGHAYTARGTYLRTGVSSFGLDRPNVLKKLRKASLVCIGGAGHAYFEKPQCDKVFDTAREIARTYSDYNNTGSFADEDAMGIAMTMLDLPPMQNDAFHARYKHAQHGTFTLDPIALTCSFVSRHDGTSRSPVIVHFARMEGPFAYHRALHTLFRCAGTRYPRPWQSEALYEYVRTEIIWRLKRRAKSMLHTSGILRRL